MKGETIESSRVERKSKRCKTSWSSELIHTGFFGVKKTESVVSLAFD